MSPAGTALRHSATSAMPISCSAKWTSVGFQTRPQAVKYPDTDEHSEMHGMLIAESLSDITVRASPIQRKPIGSASSHIIAPAAAPKNDA